MLIVKPILDKEIQKELSDKCGISYNPDALAFSAYIDNVFFGFCQFVVSGTIATLTDIRSVSDDFEASFIMSRGALNYIDLCGFHTARCTSSAGDLTLLRAIGFKEIAKNLFEMNLTDEFTGKCSNCK
ncbi:MAG: hypothetical protein E7598_04830 [Ruminococcaceae bacterium]|nr:hypothetical protein [Oscillospiraceae bacterium]